MKKVLGASLALGYLIVVAFQVYAFYHYLGVVLHMGWSFTSNCTQPSSRLSSSSSSFSPAAGVSFPQTSSPSSPLSVPSTSVTTESTSHLKNSEPAFGEVSGKHSYTSYSSASQEEDNVSANAPSESQNPELIPGVNANGTRREYALKQHHSVFKSDVLNGKVNVETSSDTDNSNIINRNDNLQNGKVSIDTSSDTGQNTRINSDNNMRERDSNSSAQTLERWRTQGSSNTDIIHDAGIDISTGETATQPSFIDWKQSDRESTKNVNNNVKTRDFGGLVTHRHPYSGPTAPENGAPNVPLAAEGAENASKADDPPISPNGPDAHETGKVSCALNLGFVIPKLALCAQFVTAFGLGLSAYLAWMVGVRGQKTLYQLAVVAFLTAVIGFMSIAWWWEGMLREKFEHQWQFWPYVCSYAYVVLAVIPLLLTHASTSRRLDSRFHMTEDEWHRWYRAQQRRQQVDDLLEAAGNGDVIYSQGSDGSWRICRLDSANEVCTTTNVDVEGGTPDTAPQTRLGQAAAVAAVAAPSGDGGAPCVTASASSATIEEKSATLVFSDESTTSTTTPKHQHGPSEVFVTSNAGVAPERIAGGNGQKQEEGENEIVAEKGKEVVEEEEMDKSISSECSPLLPAEGRSSSTSGAGGKRTKYDGTR